MSSVVPATPDVLLSATNLTKRFGGLAAVNDVSLDLWRDRIHAVIGPNGAGKSSLLLGLACLIQRECGTITFQGENVTPREETTFRRRRACEQSGRPGFLP